MRPGPFDHRRLELDHDHLADSGQAQRLVQREPDAEAAEQHPQIGAGGDGLAHERPLGAAVARVHQKRPVRDHLEVLARPAQDELAPRSLPAVDHDRPAGISAVRKRKHRWSGYKFLVTRGRVE